MLTRLLFKIAFGIVLITCVGFFKDQADAVEIVNEGQPKATIVIAADAPGMVVYAAEEFQTYIEKISGAKLSIQRIATKERAVFNKKQNYVFIGESVCTRQLHIGTKGLGVDGFKIIAEKNYLAVVGRDYKGEPMMGMHRVFSLEETFDKATSISAFGETGTLFGVYRFLEKYLGVRWFMPGELGEVIEKRASIKMGHINYKKAPDFTYRRLYFAYGFDGPKYADMVKWYRRVGFGGEYPIEIIHSFQDFAKKYSKTHPEYLYNYGKSYPNLVLTEPGLLEHFVKDIRDYFDQHPQRRIYPVMPDDMYLSKDMEKDARLKGVDDSSMGKRGRFSDYIWEFVNKVAIEVAKTHPDKMIGCCAYADYLLPPKKIDRLNSNVVVMIAKTRYLNANSRYKERYNDIIKAWTKKSKQIYVWEYYNWLYGSKTAPELPFIFPHLIAQDLRFLKGISKGEFIEAETERPPLSVAFPGLTHLNYYITARCLWDADLDIDKLLSDYYEKFYGPAKAEMKNFVGRAEAILVKEVGNMDIDESHYFKSFKLSKDTNHELLDYLKRAKEKAGDTIYGKRVDLILNEVSAL